MALREVFAPDGTLIQTIPPTVEESNADILRQRAATARATNTAFLALASPTNAQVLAQVKALTRQNQALIRLTVGLLDGSD